MTQMAAGGNSAAAQIRPMGVTESLVYAGVPALLLFLATRVVIPALYLNTNLPLVVCWFVAGGAVVFLPMFLASLVLYRREGNPWTASVFAARMRLNVWNRGILWQTVCALCAVLVSTAAILKVTSVIWPAFSARPSFLEISPLAPGDMWILGAWVPLFLLNILGEGIYWRGVVFPRQEACFGRWTWLAHGLSWWVFHVAFGASLLLILAPIIFVTSYVVQKTRSTLPDLIIHGVVNGSGFLCVAFGLVR